MDKPSVKTQLRVLGVQSFITLGLAVVLPVISRFEDKKPDLAVFAFMFIGIIGVISYETIKKLLARIEKLEDALKEHGSVRS